MKAYLKLEFMVGEDIDNACCEAIRIANLLRVTVDFDFNGVKVMAKPGACPQELADEWSSVLKSSQQIKIACAHPSKPGAQFIAMGGATMTDHNAIREAACVDGDYTMVEVPDLRALLADLDAMRAEARRYAAFFTSGLPVCFEGQEYYSKADCDAAIDAALKGASA